MAIKLNPRDHEAYFQRAAMYEKVSGWFPNFSCMPVIACRILNWSSNLILFHTFVDWQDAIGFGWLHDVQEDSPNQNWCHFKACHVLFPTEVCNKNSVVLTYKFPQIASKFLGISLKFVYHLRFVKAFIWFWIVSDFVALI